MPSSNNNTNKSKNHNNSSASSGGSATPTAIATATTMSNSNSNSNNDKTKSEMNVLQWMFTARLSTTVLRSLPMRRGYMVLMISFFGIALAQAMQFICKQAYEIRLYAIHEFGLIIHEFDPYFNYRATEYLYEHGWKAFSQWFDYMVWYPLGRPVGTTIYPGMQVTAVALKRYWFGEEKGSMSLNDVCCYMPAWFGVTATLAVAIMVYATTAPAPDRYTTVLRDIPGLRQFYHYLITPMVRFLLRLLVRFTGSTWGLPQPHPEAHNNNTIATISTATTTGYLLTPALCALCSAAIMSIVPAHLLRSVGGGYDNESIAMTALCTTFASWVISLRGHAHEQVLPTIMGAVTGVCYFYMVAAWGGYVFVLNMIGIHASILVALGRYSTKLHHAYSAFYLVGTVLAIQVPVVGWTPLKSLEQLGPLAAFVGMQFIELTEMQIRRKQLGPNSREAWKLRFTVLGAAGVLAALIVAVLVPTGYFGPISSRVRGLFVKHTKTGNPLVDSVAEHQAAKPEAYFQYLNVVCFLAPAGAVMTAVAYWNDSSSFLWVYGLAAAYFSHRMVRLILLAAPIASACGGIVLGRIAGWMIDSLLLSPKELEWSDDDRDDGSNDSAKKKGRESTEAKTTGWNVLNVLLVCLSNMTTTPKAAEATVVSSKASAGKNGPKSKHSKKKKGGNAAKEEEQEEDITTGGRTVASLPLPSPSSTGEIVRPLGDPLWVRIVRVTVSILVIRHYIPMAVDFFEMSHGVAKQISHPTIINKAQTRQGEVVVVDDYREAYWWCRDNTPEDARIMAWWDYGYQITAIGNRTTIADGNTWNHEHIALLGRILTSPEKEAHRVARHLADFVLVWTGGGGDDVAKSPHLRRIANSVYRGLCKEPTCSDFGFRSQGRPTRNMAESLLYKLHSNGIVPGVEVDRNRFKEVYRSKYGKVRIYKIMSVSKESKEWVADPANRKCDVPGSWFCPGQYPPALKKILKEKKDFRQLEDFNYAANAANQEDSEYHSDYQRQYFENLMGGADPSAAEKKKKKKKAAPKKVETPPEDEDDDFIPEDNPENVEVTPELIAMLNKEWRNTEATTAIWELIHSDSVEDLAQIFRERPVFAHIRSEDGRGPMFWAHEMGRAEIVEILRFLGVSETDHRDSKGLTPLDISKLKK